MMKNVWTLRVLVPTFKRLEGKWTMAWRESDLHDLLVVGANAKLFWEEKSKILFPTMNPMLCPCEYHATHSWFVILLLELEVNLKGIIIYDHQRPQYHFHDVALHSFRSRRSPTLSYQAPIQWSMVFRIKRGMLLLRSMMHWAVALSCCVASMWVLCNTLLVCYIALGVGSQPQRHCSWSWKSTSKAWLLLEFEANLKGIIIDDHVGIRRIPIASRSRSHRRGTRCSCSPESQFKARHFVAFHDAATSKRSSSAQ